MSKERVDKLTLDWLHMGISLSIYIGVNLSISIGVSSSVL